MNPKPEKAPSEIKQVLKKIWIGVITAVISAIILAIIFNGNSILIFSFDGITISSIVNSISTFYQKNSIPMRFNIFIWVMAFFMYFILERYDKRSLNINNKRKVKKTNLRQYIFSFYALFALLGLIFTDEYVLFIRDVYIDLSLDLGGIVLTVVGFLLLILGRQEIDGLWGPHLYDYSDKSMNRLIDSGAYKYTRHPIYMGQIILSFSSLLLSRSIFFLVFFIIVFTNSRHRANNEENHLREEFGNKYQEYCEKVKKWWIFN